MTVSYPVCSGEAAARGKRATVPSALRLVTVIVRETARDVC